MNKSVDNNGFINLSEDGELVVSIQPTLNRESRCVILTIDGRLTTDAQVFLERELDYFVTARIAALTVECGKIKAISSGCFNALLDVKINLQAIGSQVQFLDKPPCMVKIEKITKNKL